MRINIIVDDVYKRTLKDILTYQTQLGDSHISFEIDDKKVKIEKDMVTIMLTETESLETGN